MSFSTLKYSLSAGWKGKQIHFCCGGVFIDATIAGVKEKVREAGDALS